MKKKCMIFGCGQIGTIAYYKLKESFDIIAYIDNNQALWGTKKYGVAVIAPNEINAYKVNDEFEIIIAIGVYREVIRQLEQYNINDAVVWDSGLLYRYDRNDLFYPVVDCIDNYYKKNDKEKMSVLFVQTSACIRTLKIAKALSEIGVNVSLAYWISSPDIDNKEYSPIFEKIYPIYSFGSFIDFVNNSEFDVVHSSNEPDSLTVLAQKSNKPVIHDCHDLSSAYKSMTPDEMTVEFIANINSNGVIYTTEGIRKEAIRKFGLNWNQTHVLENFISEELAPALKYTKLSSTDGELHCVYEGGVIGGDKDSHRYFEEIWMKLAQSGVHVHFYTSYLPEYCRYLETLSPFIHYEGNFSSKDLSVEMSKYDVGLCILNVTEKNMQYLEFASPNKIQEYVNAGIPVAVGDIKSQIEFVEGNDFGGYLNLEGNISERLKTISRIEIKDGVLRERGYTLESRMDGLITFYRECIEKN